MAAKDEYGNPGNSPSAPPYNYAAITTSDTVDLTYLTRYVYVGGTGDIVAVDRNGNKATFKAVPVGTVLPIRVKRIDATNTTATNLVALW